MNVNSCAPQRACLLSIVRMYVRFEVIQIQLIPDNNVPRLPVLLAFYPNHHLNAHSERQFNNNLLAGWSDHTLSRSQETGSETSGQVKNKLNH